jgi:gliding motility-associated-like protein
MAGLWTMRLTIIAENGCPKVIEREVNADLIDLNLPDTLQDCIGRSVQLNPNGNPALTYNWLPNADFKDPNAPKQTVIVGENKKYSVVLGNGNCTKKKDIYVLKDGKAPTVTISVNPDTIFYGKNTQLVATVYPTNYKYTWEPETGLSNTKISNPFASPLVTTTYTLKVKAPNSECEGVAQARVVVIIPDCDEPYVFLPNAFTPDDDGINDKLEVRGALVSEVKLLIYNRWGEKVFESDGNKGGWDGYFGNTLCAPDVYGYYLEVNCIGGGKYIKKGNINLIR